MPVTGLPKILESHLEQLLSGYKLTSWNFKSGKNVALTIYWKESSMEISQACNAEFRRPQHYRAKSPSQLKRDQRKLSQFIQAKHDSGIETTAISNLVHTDLENHQSEICSTPISYSLQTSNNINNVSLEYASESFISESCVPIDEVKPLPMDTDFVFSQCAIMNVQNETVFPTAQVTKSYDLVCDEYDQFVCSQLMPDMDPDLLFHCDICKWDFNVDKQFVLYECSKCYSFIYCPRCHGLIGDELFALIHGCDRSALVLDDRRDFFNDQDSDT